MGVSTQASQPASSHDENDEASVEDFGMEIALHGLYAILDYRRFHGTIPPGRYSAGKDQYHKQFGSEFEQRGAPHSHDSPQLLRLVIISLDILTRHQDSV